jgi:hypothetical protein
VAHRAWVRPEGGRLARLYHIGHYRLGAARRRSMELAWELSQFINGWTTNEH